MSIHKTPVRVIYGDTDNMGQAYHANYFRWFETGRTEMLRALGLSYKEVEKQGIFLPVSEIYCRFSAPVRYDDMLIIETAVDRQVKGGIKFDYILWNDDETRAVAKGFTKHACVNREGRVVRPPAFLATVIQQAALQNGAV